MSLIYQDPSHPGTMAAAFRALLSPATEAIHLAVAYATHSGVATLLQAGVQALGTDHWEQLEKILITTFDFNRTEPEALRTLWADGFEIWIANLSFEPTQGVSGTSWHPKLYVTLEPNLRNALVTSANLSRAALTINTEAGVILQEDPEGPLDAAWEALATNAVVLTDELLSRYESNRTPQPPEHQEPLPPATEPALEALPFFTQAVNDDWVDPARYAAFWVDTGSMSSSGSHAQLELPRRANTFFGFDFDDYQEQQETIGEIDLVMNRVSWERPLAWHGDNGMERINLPTPHMIRSELGFDFDWRNKVILFRRGDVGEFLVSAIDDDDPDFQSWLSESAARGTLFRLGVNSPRLCGLL